MKQPGQPVQSLRADNRSSQTYAHIRHLHSQPVLLDRPLTNEDND